MLRISPYWRGLEAGPPTTARERIVAFGRAGKPQARLFREAVEIPAQADQRRPDLTRADSWIDATFSKGPGR